MTGAEAGIIWLGYICFTALVLTLLVWILMRSIWVMMVVLGFRFRVGSREFSLSFHGWGIAFKLNSSWKTDVLAERGYAPIIQLGPRCIIGKVFLKDHSRWLFIDDYFKTIHSDNIL